MSVFNVWEIKLDSDNPVMRFFFTSLILYNKLQLDILHTLIQNEAD